MTKVAVPKQCFYDQEVNVFVKELVLEMLSITSCETLVDVLF